MSYFTFPSFLAIVSQCEDIWTRSALELLNGVLGPWGCHFSRLWSLEIHETPFLQSCDIHCPIRSPLTDSVVTKLSVIITTKMYSGL